MNLQFDLFRDSNAIKRPPTLRSDIKSFIQGVRSRTKYATSSFVTKIARTSSLEHSWII